MTRSPFIGAARIGSPPSPPVTTAAPSTSLRAPLRAMSRSSTEAVAGSVSSPFGGLGYFASSSASSAARWLEKSPSWPRGSTGGTPPPPVGSWPTRSSGATTENLNVLARLSRTYTLITCSPVGSPLVTHQLWPTQPPYGFSLFFVSRSVGVLPGFAGSVNSVLHATSPGALLEK